MRRAERGGCGQNVSRQLAWSGLHARIERDVGEIDHEVDHHDDACGDEKDAEQQVEIAALQRAPFSIFQLDGTAYPGNSGSPVYDPATGKVLGVINAVFVKGLKETAITAPSGITYAIPANYVRDLLRKN